MTRIAWIVLAILTGAMALSGVLFPGWIGVLLLLPALLAWAVLLIAYRRCLASWRAVVLTWALFGLLRGVAVGIDVGNDALSNLIGTVLAVLGLYALLAGYAALLALVLCRDVSVAYLFLPVAIGAPTLLLTVQMAGGVTRWFAALTAPSTVARALVLEPLLLSLSCMEMLGLMALVPHALITLAREARGN